MSLMSRPATPAATTGRRRGDTMARYRLSKPAYVPANGNPLPRTFAAGDTIVVADDMAPGDTWVPLDRAAEVAFAAKRAARPQRQVIDNRTGLMRAATIRR